MQLAKLINVEDVLGGETEPRDTDLLAECCQLSALIRDDRPDWDEIKKQAATVALIADMITSMNEHSEALAALHDGQEY